MTRRQAGRLAFTYLQSFKSPASQATTVRGVASSAKPGKDGLEASKSASGASTEAAQVQQKRRIGLPAQEEAYDEPVIDFSKKPLPVHIDRVGAVSVVVPEEEGQDQPQGLFQNRDGYRYEDGRYAAFTQVSMSSLVASSASFV